MTTPVMIRPETIGAPANSVDREPSPAVLSLKDVHVRFGGVSALTDVSISIPPGPGISAVIGPNGAGKTTLFNVMTGIVAPSEGDIFVNGVNVTGRRPDQIFGLGVARSFQGVRLFEHLSVEKNVLLAAQSAGHSGSRSWFNRAAARERTAVALRSVGLEQSAWSSLPANLTLWQRRLVEIARAIANEPDAVLLDEPAAGLNTAEKEKICDLMRHLAHLMSCRFVVVEHDMKVVMSVADMIWVMNFGRLLASGVPDKIKNDPAVIEAYLGKQSQHE